MYDPELYIEGEHLKLVQVGIDAFSSLYKNEYNLLNYKLYVNLAEAGDILVYEVGFIPLPIGSAADGFLNIPVRGIWANGPGVKFSFDPDTYKLVKTTYMR